MAYPVSSEREHIQRLFDIRSHADPNSHDLANYVETNIYEGFTGEQKYLFELLQNADDKGSKKKPLVVTFKLVSDRKDSYLIISHTGKHFKSSDVETITSIAQQQNRKKSEEVTGYKGIGFKAIFSISDWVAIFSKGYQFRFDKNFCKPGPKTEYRYPWVLAPIWTEHKDLSPVVSPHLQPDEVNFIVKLDPKVVPSVLKDFDVIAKKPEIILFLRRVQQVQIIHEKANQIFTLQKEGEKKYSIYEGDKVRSSWLKYSVPFAISNEYREILENLKACPPRLKTAPTTLLTFAVKVDEKGELNSPESGALYSYLPTQVHLGGLPFTVNGDFLLDPSRTKLQDNDWNIGLLKAVGLKQFSWLASLNQDENIRFQILKLFKKPSLVGNESFTSAFSEGFNHGKSTIPFLPSYKKPTELLTIGEATFDETGFYSAFPEIPAPISLLDYRLEGTQQLNLKNTITPTHLCRILPGLIAKHNETKFQRRLFDFLAPKTQSPWTYLLPETPILLSETFQYMKPKEIYFRSRTDIPIPPEIPLAFVNSEFVTNPLFRAWAIKMGARNATEIDIFRGKILPMIPKGIDEKNSLSITGFIFKLYKKGLLNQQDFFSLTALPLLNGEGSLIHPSSLFLSEAYHPSFKLSQSPSTTVSPLYAKQDPSVDLWKNFFAQLGVQQEIAITRHEHQYSVRKGREEKRENFNGYLTFLKNQNMSAKSPKDSHYLVHFLDCNLFNSESLSQNPEIWRVFWKKVVQNWETIKHTHGYYCSGNGQDKNVTVSFLDYMVRSSNCVPCIDGHLRKPSEVFFKKIHSNPHSADLDPPLTKEQGDFFKFNTKLNVKEAVMLLSSLVKTKGVKIEAFTECLLLFLNLNPPEKEMRVLLSQYPLYLPAQDGKFYRIEKLQCFALSQGSPPMNTSHWLRELPGMSREQLIKVCTLLQMKIIKDEDVEIGHSGQLQVESNLLPRLMERLPSVSRIEATYREINEEAFLWRMREKLEKVNFIKATRLFYAYHNSISKDNVFAFYDEKNSTFYLHKEWDYTSTIDPFCRALSQFLGLSPETEKHLRDILTVNDLNEWMQEHNFTAGLLDPSTLLPPLIDEEGKDEIKPLNSPPPPSPKEQKEPVATPQTSPEGILNLKKGSSTTPQTPPQEIRKEILVKPTAFDFRKVKLTKPQLIQKNKEDFDPNDTPSPKTPTEIRKELFPPKKGASEKPSNLETSADDEEGSRKLLTITSPYTQDIGEWGEEFVYNKLKEDYKNKYSDCEQIETDSGFKMLGKNLDLEVIWLNKNGETKASYDLMIIKNQVKRIIEVKATLSSAKAEFKLGQREYQVMQHYKERYRFFRVYEAGSKNARIETVKNPAALLEQGKIAINSFNLHL